MHWLTAAATAGRHRVRDDIEEGKRTERNFCVPPGKKTTVRAFQPQILQKQKKRMLFLKNKAGELLKTKGNGQKQTENKPETKLPKLLKTIEGPKKQSENKPKNKAGHVVENKRPLKNKPKERPSPFAGSVFDLLRFS